MRIHTLLLVLPIAMFPAAALQKPVSKPAEKPLADEVAVPAMPAIPTQFLSPIENVIKQLAKGGREAEVKELLEVMVKLGYPKPNMDKLHKSAKDELARAKMAIDALPAGAKQLRASAQQLATFLEKTEDPAAKEQLARCILVLDGELEAAHKVLGHEKVGTAWIPAGFKEMRARRGEILRKVEEAKKLEVDMETGEVDDELIQQACGVKATMVRRGNIELHSNFSVERTERMLREGMRALAMSDWLRGDKPDAALKLPPNPEKVRSRNIWVLIDSRERFNKLALDLKAAGSLTDESNKMLESTDSKTGSFNVKSGEFVVLAQWEQNVLYQLVVNLTPSHLREGILTPVTVGHMNWLTLTFFGCTIGSYVYKEELGRKRSDTHVETEEQKREREELLRLAKSGIAGSRTWMRYLVEHGEDPPFRNSFVPAMGMIQGNDLHKCTSIVEFIQEGNLLRSLMRKLSSTGMDNPIESYNTALSSIGEGWTLGEMESKWRAWILGDRTGVAERIDKENLNAWPPDALSALEYMNEIRENAFEDKLEGVWKLKFDPNLSEQCALHAQYLVLHPEQQKWPDAHEEYADKEGYTVEGAWAGTHSVIAWGDIADFKESIDGWMGTFYHRIPLIDPGVMRLGWGHEDIYWVMDMSSLAAPYEKPYVVVWPYEGQKDVPVHFFGNEHPDPVPDPEVEAGMVIEEEIFGYPVTIQTNPVNEQGEAIDIVMKLFEGSSKDKKEVECYFSTPNKPTNPEAAPSGVWCLIPKNHLKPNTEYKVTADWTTAGRGTQTTVGKHMEWTFRTD